MKYRALTKMEQAYRNMWRHGGGIQMSFGKWGRRCQYWAITWAKWHKKLKSQKPND